MRSPSSSVDNAVVPSRSAVMSTTTTAPSPWPPRRRRLRLRKSRVLAVTFCPSTKVRVVTHAYPSDFFYTRDDMVRFRMEAREERLIAPIVPATAPTALADSPIQRAFDVASSSMVIVAFLIVGMAAATICCVPILLLVKMASAVLPSYSSSSSLYDCASSQEDDVDSSIRPYAPPEDNMDANNASGRSTYYAERILLNFLGGNDGRLWKSTSCRFDGTVCVSAHG